MNKNSEAIIILCADLGITKNSRPFQPVEWGMLAKKMLECNVEPYQVIEMTNEEIKEKLELEDKVVERIRNLILRKKLCLFEVETFKKLGVNIVTRADRDYPRRLKQKLQSSCPPLFYYAGNIRILNKKAVGIIGTREVTQKEVDFIRSTLVKLNPNEHAIVTGGGKGTDAAVQEIGFNKSYDQIQFVADSLFKRMKDPMTLKQLRNNQMLILSITRPDSNFKVGMLMGRNKYIYSQTDLTIIVNSDFEAGSIWNGALEAQKKKLCNIYCMESTRKGNQALIEKGCKKIDIIWNAEVPDFKFVPIVKEDEEVESYENYLLY